MPQNENTINIENGRGKAPNRRKTGTSVSFSDFCKKKFQKFYCSVSILDHFFSFRHSACKKRTHNLTFNGNDRLSNQHADSRCICDADFQWNRLNPFGKSVSNSDFNYTANGKHCHFEYCGAFWSQGLYIHKQSGFIPCRWYHISIKNFILLMNILDTIHLVIDINGHFVFCVRCVWTFWHKTIGLRVDATTMYSLHCFCIYFGPSTNAIPY